MKTQSITEINKEAIKKIGNYIEANDWEKEPVIKKVSFYNFTDLNCSISSILEAIESIGYSGKESDLCTCANLASIARKLMPNEEMEFLDKLLIKDSLSKNSFTNITDI